MALRESLRQGEVGAGTYPSSMQHTRRENPAYLQYIREQPCAFCGAAAPSDPHHWNGRGPRDEKRNDYETIPACRLCHERFHSWGPGKLFEFHRLSPREYGSIVAQLLVGFFTRPDHSGGPI
jgi:hypothetical protein